MTLDEAIKDMETIAEENQRVVDTKDVTIDMLFCDDEEIEERLEKYQKTADNYRQLAEWLKDYKRLLEQEPNIKALGEELRKVREGIKNEKVLIGFNMAVAICNKHLGQEPCDFCETIYPDADTTKIAFRRGKYSDFNKDSFITIDDEGKYHANIVPDDPYETGYLCDIKFCPYCGRKLRNR